MVKPTINKGCDELPKGPERTHVIVFANEKGGTGKSTTAVHVAIALAARGAPVVRYRWRAESCSRPAA